MSKLTAVLTSWSLLQRSEKQNIQLHQETRILNIPKWTKAKNQVWIEVWSSKTSMFNDDLNPEFWFLLLS